MPLVTAIVDAGKQLGGPPVILLRRVDRLLRGAVESAEDPARVTTRRIHERI